MRPDMLPQQQVVYFDRALTIRGVDITLRVFPAANTFTFNSSRVLTPQEKVAFAQYMRNEGFLDDPSPGSSPTTDIEQVT